MTITDRSADASLPTIAGMSPPGGFMTYIREVSLEGQRGFAVCTDEGVQLAVFASMDAAYFSARQFDLSPHSLH